MAQPKAGKLVRQDADGTWLAASLAASKSGLTKPELARRALAGELRFREDKFGRPIWFDEGQIAELAKARLAFTLDQPPKPKRKPSKAQLEASYAKQASELAKVSRQGRGGPVTAHYERVMIKEIFSKAKRPGEGE